MDLSQVSRTAVLLLICRAVESEKNKLDFDDPMAELCLDKLMSLVSERDRLWISKHKKLYAGLQARDARSGTLRGKSIDRIANRFIADHPRCTVINLACGFDTRFWRIDHEMCKYIEIDLPAVIDLKKEILKGELEYELLAASALDTSWIDKVTRKGNSDFLLIVEGLFMWFPEGEAKRLFMEFGNRFNRSQLVLDMVPERYTRGLWKEFIRLHSRLEWGLDVAWEFGIEDPLELETFSKAFKVIGVEKGSAGPIITVSINPVR